MSAGDRSTRTILVVEDLGQQHLSARSLAAVLRRAGWDARLVDFSRGQDGEGDDTSTAAIIALAAKAPAPPDHLLRPLR